jgi:hypothetical protein
MGDIALQIERTISGSITPGENAIFNIISHSTGNIIYDNSTGTVTFLEIGRYKVQWFAVMQSSSYINGVVLGFTSGDTTITGNSNTKTGEVVGIGLIDITTVPAFFTLKNTGSGSYYYSENIPIKASLVITRDDTAETVDAYCFAIDQLINILSQMITSYPATTWTVFGETLVSYSGVPYELYTAPNAEKPGLLRLKDRNNDFEAIPIEHITAIYPGDGTVYDPAFTYLTSPDTITHDCNYDFLESVLSYLPVGTMTDLRLGPAITASGEVFRNEYGLVILSDAGGNTPVFVASPKILRIFLSEAAPGLRKPGSGKPHIGVNKDL